ncbi:MAG: hypothetical protein E7563_05895 [Ruminococcaceae bacterium]|nr:hypothetical protein [Oscillospiraceae bacterium]
MADLTLLTAEDITIEGEVAVDGSILLPEGTSILDVKDNLTSQNDDGIVRIGENCYYYFENGNLKCGNEVSHFTAEDSENVANCKHKAVCDICGAEYGDTNDNHIGEIIPKFDWDNPYDGECYVYVEFYCAECGRYVDSVSGYASLKDTVEAEDCMHPGSELYEVSFEYEGITYTDTKSFTLKSDKHTGNLVNGFCSECGGFEPAKYNEETGVYEISNAGQLYWYAQKLNEENAEIYAKLINDITVPEDAPNWTPINCSYAYFDGNFNTISGLKCIGGEYDTYIGLFGNEGWWYEITNLHIEDSYFEGNNAVGAVVACLGNGGFVKNCYVTNTTVKGDSSNVGTLVGYLGLGRIINCYVDTDTLAGYYNSSYATVENSYYLADTDDGEGGKTAEQFASGEVAYLLQSGVEGEDIYDDEWNVIDTIIPEIWGQKIGADTYPVFGGEKVCTVTDSDGNITGYTNTVQTDKLAGYTISLGDKIAVNYYMSLTEKTLNDANAKMVFTVPNTGSTYTVEIPVSEAVKNSDYYVFTCEVAAKEMTSVIKAKLVTSTDELVLDDYTVQKYAEVILSDTVKYAKEQALVKAMLNYGAYAQVYFNYNTDNLANDTEYMTDEEKALVEKLDLSAYNAIVEGSEEGVTFYGGTLSLKSETAIKLYFMVEGDVSALTVTVNGEETELVKNGNLYELKISDIPAHLLGAMYEVKIGGLTLNYGAFSYGQLAMGTDKTELKNAIKALYAYYEKAAYYAG